MHMSQNTYDKKLMTASIHTKYLEPKFIHTYAKEKERNTLKSHKSHY